MKLTKLDELIANSVGENNFHFVTFGPNNIDNKDFHKIFRKLNLLSTDKILNLNYWIVEDAKLAEQIGINTSNAGDVYVLREAQTPISPAKGNITIEDYPYTSERLFTY
jgi:hypothetical protein